MYKYHYLKRHYIAHLQQEVHWLSCPITYWCLEFHNASCKNQEMKTSIYYMWGSVWIYAEQRLILPWMKSRGSGQRACNYNENSIDHRMLTTVPDTWRGRQLSSSYELGFPHTTPTHSVTRHTFRNHLVTHTLSQNSCTYGRACCSHKHIIHTHTHTHMHTQHNHTTHAHTHAHTHTHTCTHAHTHTHNPTTHTHTQPSVCSGNEPCARCAQLGMSTTDCECSFTLLPTGNSGVPCKLCGEHWCVV